MKLKVFPLYKDELSAPFHRTILPDNASCRGEQTLAKDLLLLRLLSDQWYLERHVSSLMVAGVHGISSRPIGQERG